MTNPIVSIWQSARKRVGRTRLLSSLLGLTHYHEDDAHTIEGEPSAAPRRGLIMVQIDGLSELEFDKALERGELPFLKRLITSENYQQHALYSGLPSSTPAVQAEIFYGIRTAVPAFGFLHRADGKLNRMFDPASAIRVQHDLEIRGEPLLAGGSAYCNIYTGGAAESHFCASSLGWDDMLHKVRPLHWVVATVLHLPTFIRTLVLALIEFVLANVDLIRGVRRGYRFVAELKFIASRVAICIVLRDLITTGAKMDIARGLPVIHLNYIGYDEQAHRRGPNSAFAHWTLRGIDAAIEKLWSARGKASHREYDFWVYADHGQEAVVPYEKRTGTSIREAVGATIIKLDGEQPGPLTSISEHVQHTRARLLGGSRLQRLFSDTANGWGSSRVDLPAIVAMGPVGHVYLGRHADSSERDRLAQLLTENADVPAALYRGENDVVHARTATALLTLPIDSDALLGKSHPKKQAVANDLVALCLHIDSGDVVMLGWALGSQPISFALENGSHAGAAPVETSPFVLLPQNAVIDPPSGNCLRPADLHKAALQVLGRV